MQRAAWQDEHTGLPYTPKSASSARGGHTTFLHLTADRSMDDLINVAFSSRSGWRNVSFSSETFVDYLTSHGRQHGGRALEVFSLYVASGQLKAPPHSLASHLMEAIGGAKGEKLDDPKLRARLVAVQQEIHEELNSTRTVAAFEAEYLSEPMRAARLKLHDQARSLEVGACWVCLTNVDGRGGRREAQPGRHRGGRPAALRVRQVRNDGARHMRAADALPPAAHRLWLQPLWGPRNVKKTPSCWDRAPPPGPLFRGS